jgi:CubicO group peptidase (beta-lactamase class C family)
MRGSGVRFGFPGSGGSLGFADPKAGIGYAYVTNQMGTPLTGDPRDLALRNALYLEHSLSTARTRCLKSKSKIAFCSFAGVPY